jgi:hypothetical protein
LEAEASALSSLKRSLPGHLLEDGRPSPAALPGRSWNCRWRGWSQRLPMGLDESHEILQREHRPPP